MAPSSGGKNLFFYFALVLFIIYPISLDGARPFNLPCSAFLKELVYMRGGQVIKIVLAFLFVIEFIHDSEDKVKIHYVL
jgi:hypothetical protein